MEDLLLVAVQWEIYRHMSHPGEEGIPPPKGLAAWAAAGTVVMGYRGGRVGSSSCRPSPIRPHKGSKY